MASMPGTERPKARVRIFLGSKLSVMNLPASVIDHISTTGKENLFSNISCWFGSIPAHNPNFTLWLLSILLTGSFSRMLGTIPCMWTTVTSQSTISCHQVEAWKRSGNTRQPPVNKSVGTHMDKQFA